MLKITKGLKKKKKGKKSKHKDDDLFDSSELEQYRKEQQQKQVDTAETSESANTEKSEEWKQFKVLTSGVDDILKKTQGDLDRIKSTSFFQKKTVTTAEKERSEEVKVAPKPPKGKWVGFESVDIEEKKSEEENSSANDKDLNEKQVLDKFEEETVEEEEEESELEDEQDDIFDTSYVDVVASGEVKLAYVPDSPIKEDEFDPFDTSIVDKVIKVDPQEKKKKLVSLGCAVEVLTGKLEKPVNTSEVVKPQKRRPRAKDLLLGSFEDGESEVKTDVTESVTEIKSILDDDPVFAEETSAVLSYQPVSPSESKSDLVKTGTLLTKETPKEVEVNLESLVKEFVPQIADVKQESPEEELDDEFAALAAESLAKKHSISSQTFSPESSTKTDKEKATELDNLNFDGEDDPFDTSFASQVLPGKFELKLIEKEILDNNDIIVPKISTGEQKLQEIIKQSALSNKVNNDVDELKINNETTELKTLTIKHRDLLGGSTTDLSNISQDPIVPLTAESSKSELEIDDPFDTSIIDKIVAPGKTELKFLEKELLVDNKSTVDVEIDNDFDPRAEESFSKPLNRPDNLHVTGKRVSVPKIVAFDLKSSIDAPDLLAVSKEESTKISKPLTPYYPTTNPPLETSDIVSNCDPFDTSYVKNLPGKLELKLIEKELSSTQTDIEQSLSDEEFDPRAKPLEENASSCEVSYPNHIKSSLQPDIISEEVATEGKLHTPVIPKKVTEIFEESQEIDPFDTSIANVLVPGKAEIKILESELIYAQETPPVKTSGGSIAETIVKKLSEPRLSITDVLEQPSDDITVKPLTPVPACSIDQEYIDPFDTSIVGEILPGKTEIKILESELLN